MRSQDFKIKCNATLTDFDGLLLQLDVGVAHDDFLDPQTLGTSAACGIRALLDALAMYLSCAQASGLE